MILWDICMKFHVNGDRRARNFLMCKIGYLELHIETLNSVSLYVGRRNCTDKRVSRLIRQSTWISKRFMG